MLDKILKFLYLILFFLTPFIMLAQTSELFEFNKMLFIYTVTVLILFVWVLKMIIYKKIIVNNTSLFVILSVFLVSQIFSTIFSIDKHTSLFGYYGRFNGGLVSIIAYFLLFTAFTSNFLNKDLVFLHSLLKTSLFSSFIVMLWGLPGKIGYDLSCFLFTGQLNNNCWTSDFRPAERIFSTLGQPNWLGAYLAINFFIGLYFLIKSISTSKSTKYFILNSLYLIINFACILFTRSRSTLVAVIISLFLFSILFFLLSRKVRLNVDINYKKLLLILLSFLVLTLIFKTGIDKIDKYLNLSAYVPSKSSVSVASKKQLNNIVIQQSSVTDSFSIRKIVWEGAWNLALKYPLFGTGVETFAYSYYFARPLSHNLTSEWDFLYNKAHNEYLNYLATTGFIGLLSYLILIGFTCYVFVNKIFSSPQSTIKKINKKDFNNLAIQQFNNKLLLICLFLSYIAILITNFFGFSITIINLYFYLIPAFAVILIAIEPKPAQNAQLENFSDLTSLIRTYKQKTMIFGLFVFCAYLLSSVLFYFIADLQYAAANKYIREGEYQKSAQALNEALKLRYEHVYEDKLSSVLSNLSLVAASQKETKLTADFILLSDNFNRKSLLASPYNVLYWKTRYKNQYIFYEITSDQNNLKAGFDALEQASSLSPTDPKIPYTKALYYSILEDSAKDKVKKEEYEKLAVKTLDNSIKLKPDLVDGYLLKGQLLKKYGQKEEAKKDLQFILDKLDPNNQDAKKELSTF